MTDQDSVSRASRFQPNGEMSVIGFIVAAGSLLLLVPVAPFLAILWLMDRLTGRDPGDRAEDRSERHLETDPDQQTGSRVEA